VASSIAVALFDATRLFDRSVFQVQRISSSRV
jgi:hypothetical protein